MVAAFRNPLGKSLASMIMPGDQPPVDMGDFPLPTGNPASAKQGMSKGQLIAGILGDALAAATGGSPVFTQSIMAQRQREQDMAASEAQWSRRRQAEQQDWQARQAYERANPAPTAMERNLAVWQRMTPEQRAAYQEMQDAQGGPITTTLPNGQLYVGPKSGLATALSGGVPKPVGKLTPIDGGPTPPASGPFRR